MAPYMASLLSPIMEVLQDYFRGTERDSFLWSELIGMLDKSFAIDSETRTLPEFCVFMVREYLTI